MVSNDGGSGAGSKDGEVMASVDGDEGDYVIADITEDEAWLSMHADDAPALPAWR